MQRRYTFIDFDIIFVSQPSKTETLNTAPHREYSPPQRVQPSTENTALHREYSPLQRVQPSTENAALHRECSPPQRIQPSTKNAALHREYSPPQRMQCDFLFRLSFGFPFQAQFLLITSFVIGRLIVRLPLSLSCY
jgi:hypothetical protein